MNSSSEPVPSTLPSIEIEHQPGGSDPSIPYIIGPRLTFLLNGKPTLRWNEVPGATYYIVRIMKDSDVLWEEKVSSTEIVYSGDQRLQPGLVYFLTIEANNGTSSLDSGETPLAFEIIEPEIAQEVRAAVKEITQKTDLNAEAKAMQKARLFNALTLKDEAIRTLEQLLVEHRFSEESQKAAIFLTLGKLYGGVGLNLLAKDYYSKAIALASAAEDLKVLAEAKAGLAGVERMLKLEKTDEVEQLSREVQVIYEKLGDLEGARKLEERLVSLSSRVEVRRSSLLFSSQSQITAVSSPRAAKFPPCRPWRVCALDP